MSFDKKNVLERSKIGIAQHQLPLHASCVQVERIGSFIVGACRLMLLPLPQLGQLLLLFRHSETFRRQPLNHVFQLHQYALLRVQPRDPSPIRRPARLCRALNAKR